MLNHRAGTVLLALLAMGCTTLQTPNQPIGRVEHEFGYRPTPDPEHRGSGRAWVLLTFSGGGTRAATLAYGVMQVLRDTEITIDGRKTFLLDEVDAISGVSGGSFPAAYYGLFGDRIFEEFEERFIRRNVQRDLILRALLPWNLVRLMTSASNRTPAARGAPA